MIWKKDRFLILNKWLLQTEKLQKNIKRLSNVAHHIVELGDKYTKKKKFMGLPAKISRRDKGEIFQEMKEKLDLPIVVQ